MLAAYDPERLTAAEAAFAAAKAAGCTCDPDITIDGTLATVRHDNWCALLRRQDVN